MFFVWLCTCFFSEEKNSIYVLPWKIKENRDARNLCINNSCFSLKRLHLVHDNLTTEQSLWEESIFISPINTFEEDRLKKKKRWTLYDNLFIFPYIISYCNAPQDFHLNLWFYYQWWFHHFGTCLFYSLPRNPLLGSKKRLWPMQHLHNLWLLFLWKHVLQLSQASPRQVSLYVIFFYFIVFCLTIIKCFTLNPAFFCKKLC